MAPKEEPPDSARSGALTQSDASVPLAQGEDEEDPEKGRSYCGSCCGARSTSQGQEASRSRTMWDTASTMSPNSGILKVNQRNKIYAYDHESMLNWRALFVTVGTIFSQRRVWIVVPMCLAVAMLSASIVFFCVPSARKLDTGKFNDFVNYIKVFIAFMLGFFLNNSFRRWWASVSCFKKFLISIKQLMYTLQAIIVGQHRFMEIKRLCIASCYILNEEVHIAQLSNHRAKIHRWEQCMEWLVDVGYLTTDERQDLHLEAEDRAALPPQRHADSSEALDANHHGVQEKRVETTHGNLQSLGVHTAIIWTWIGENLTELKNLEGVAPPMYVRLLFLCHDCMAQVEELKTNLTVQMPFTYAHMLAALVHLCNVTLAISCGLAFGSAWAEIVSRNNQMERFDNPPGTKRRHGRVIGEFYEAVQTLGMQIVILLVQPLLYQAFLVIAHAMCYPYGDETNHMPTETFIQQMHYELEVMQSQIDCQDNRAKRRNLATAEAQKKKGKDDDDEEDDDDDG